MKKLNSEVKELKLICHFHYLLAASLGANYSNTFNFYVSIDKTCITVALNYCNIKEDNPYEDLRPWPS